MVGAKITALQAGSVLAYLSGRVLGQYEVFSGEPGQLLVGPGQLAVRPAQLEDVDDLGGEQLKRARGRLGEVARVVVEDAQGADRDAAGRDEGARGVEADLADDPGDERVPREAVVDAGVGHDDPLAALEHLRAHGVVARADRWLHADRGHLVLVAVVDDVDGGGGDVAHGRCELDEPLQVGLRRAADDVVRRDRLAPRQVLGRAHASPSGHLRLEETITPHRDVHPMEGC